MSDEDPGLCPVRGRCSLFPILREREALGYWLGAYCSSEFARCARYEETRSGGVLPSSLLPNGRHMGKDDETDDSSG